MATILSLPLRTSLFLNSYNNGIEVTELSVQNKWTELFPTIVSIARTIEVISSGMLGSQNGSLQLVYS